MIAGLEPGARPEWSSPAAGYTAPSHSQQVKTGDRLDDKPSLTCFSGSRRTSSRDGRLFRLIDLDMDRCADPHPLRRKTPGQELYPSSRAAIPAPRARSIRSMPQLSR